MPKEGPGASVPACGRDPRRLEETAAQLCGCNRGATSWEANRAAPTFRCHNIWPRQADPAAATALGHFRNGNSCWRTGLYPDETAAGAEGLPLRPTHPRWYSEG